MKPVFALLLFICCSNKQDPYTTKSELPQPAVSADSAADIATQRFKCPPGFTRAATDSTSFAFYLRNLPLKPVGSEVRLFDGRIKPAGGVYCAVIDMEITARDLQQCADALMRLRGEYLFAKKQYNAIEFRFLGDGRMHRYLDYAGNDRSYKTFRKYMDHVFAFANTASLHRQLNAAAFNTLQAGDVLIQTGNPYGHAVMVTDVCSDVNGRKLFMLAQSYMPAQETQILLNPASNTVWYEAIENSSIQTPEWTFQTGDLRRW
jgi:hypothetical protein